MFHFHVSLHVRPDSSVDETMIDVGGQRIACLDAPREGQATPFPLDFEAAAAALARLERMHVEPDGSFVWVAPRGTLPWQVDGQLFDRGDRLLYVELKGSCPAAELDRLLAALGWPAMPVMFQLVHEGVFVSDLEFRRLINFTS